jgi:3-dehydroquinate dehydratase II
MNKKKILVINGPNLNMLGQRDKNHYGSVTLKEICEMMRKEDYFDYIFFQSNHEGDIIDKIQFTTCDAIIINPGAYTHTSVAIHDALEIKKCEKVEVHLSDVDNRDDFRKINFIRDVCTHTVTGLKEYSYIEAIKYLKKVL